MSILTTTELIGQIASRIGRTDLDPDPYGVYIIRDAVLDRIDFYKKKCFYGGQVLDDSIVTVPGTGVYAYPEGWEEILSIAILVNGQWLQLDMMNYEALDALDSQEPPQRQQPMHWAPFNNGFRLYPVPDVVYSVEIIMNLPPGLPADNASNYWTGDAKSLVINGAAAEIAVGYLHNPILENMYRPLEEREMLAQESKTMRLRGYVQVESYL